MEDNKQFTQTVNTANTVTNEGNKAGNKTFTQADMDNLAGKIRGEEKAKNDQAIKDAVANALAEYDRQAKLTEEEREKEAKSKREAELKQREDEITLRERRLEAQELLSAKNIPIDLVDFVVDLDANKTKENIEKLAKTYNKSVETGVTDKLKGTPPTDFSNSNNKDVRIANLNKIFTKNLYENVCRSLFEKDKLLFSFVICYKIIVGTTGNTIKIPETQWRYFLAGPSGDVEIPTNPTKWINKNEWATFYRQLHYMDNNFEEMKGIENSFMKQSDKFKPINDSVSPQSDPLPGEWDTKLSEFLKLCFIKMIRPDKQGKPDGTRIR